MRRKIRNWVSLAAALALMLGVWAQTTHAGEYAEYLGVTGDGRNAPFRMVVPMGDDWNRTLLVYARGTGSIAMLDGTLGLTPLTNVPGVVNEQGFPDNTAALELEEDLLEMGYALVASDYKKLDPDPREGLLSWIVEDGIRDTLDVTDEARRILSENHGQLNRTILWGRSQGSIVSLKILEEEPWLYDGVITGCTVGAGAPRAWDLGIDFALAFDVAFGWDEQNWGSVGGGDVPENLSFQLTVAPRLITLLSDPKIEFVRLVTGLPLEGFYPTPGFETFNWLFAYMLFLTEVRGDLECKAGGRVGQNDGHVYSLTEEEKQYLAGLDVDADAFLNAMDRRKKIMAGKKARQYVKDFAEFSGDISRPVISMHTTTDGLVIPAHESAYLETVEAAGKSDLLVQAFTDAVGHCTFTPEQWLATVAAMESWLDTERPPGKNFFSKQIGFDNKFTPPSWPQPPQSQ